MSVQEDHERREAYFTSRYLKIAEHWFHNNNRVELRDHETEVNRLCRFCGRGRPEVQFRKLAHAVSDFLGNRSIISMNECDECNVFFGDGCEDHLSKATMLHRTLAGIPRKHGVESTFKDRMHDEKLRIDSKPGAVNIRVPEPNSVNDLVVDGELPETIPLRGDLRSQPHSPIEAARALVKFACSICPKGELSQIQCAIEWVRGGREVRFSQFPVGFAFTPGAEAIGEKASHVMLLLRRDDGPEPYLWFLVQFRNFRFQIPLPFCPADDGVARSRMEHFQSLFPPSWPRGETTFRWLNWSGTEKVRTSWNVSHHCVESISITRPADRVS
ncbi:HNH endonuclease [Roseiconus lacunae]|uniref:HNH endonuclease n=1 Tax=Roseiconus lacunae TaxID=2605694 RepID=UPI0011F32BDA|nr:HNH endonuclease [Roseiconus lacunae]